MIVTFAALTNDALTTIVVVVTPSTLMILLMVIILIVVSCVVCIKRKKGGCDHNDCNIYDEIDNAINLKTFSDDKNQDGTSVQFTHNDYSNMKEDQGSINASMDKNAAYNITS